MKIMIFCDFLRFLNFDDAIDYSAGTGRKCEIWPEMGPLDPQDTSTYLAQDNYRGGFTKNSEFQQDNYRGGLCQIFQKCQYFFQRKVFSFFFTKKIIFHYFYQWEGVIVLEGIYKGNYFPPIFTSGDIGSHILAFKGIPSVLLVNWWFPLFYL